MHYIDFQLRPSVWGTIRWPKTLGKPLGVPPEKGLRVTYAAAGGSLPSSEYFPGFGFVSHRCLTMSEPEDGPDHLVTFWGPNVVDLRAAAHCVVVHFEEGVPWEPLPVGYLKRQIDPPGQQFTPDSVSELEPFTISATRFILDKAFVSALGL
jgi:hypothetical protein